jgi:HEAT repeat protein
MTAPAKEIKGLGEREVLARLKRDGLSEDERRRLVQRLWVVGTAACVGGLLACAGSSDRRVRVSALRALLHIGTPAAIDGLIAGLESADPVTMSFAAQHLARAGEQRAIPALIAALERTDRRRDKDGRWALALALGRLPHRDSVPVLAATLDDPHATTAKLAAVALGQIRCREATAALEKAVSELSWWRARYARKALRFSLAHE